MTSASEELMTNQLILAGRLRGSLASMYQTLLGITQGGALGYLVITALGEIGKGHFNFVQWWLAGLTFFVLILVWYTIAMETASLTWIPGLADSLIPFLMGAYELCFIFSIQLVPSLGLLPWLVCMVIGAGFQFIGCFHGPRQAEKVPESAVIVNALRKDIETRNHKNLVCLIVFACLALGIGFTLPTGDIVSANKFYVIVVMVIVTASHAYCFFYMHRYFRAVIKHARNPQRPDGAASTSMSSQPNTLSENRESRKRGRHRKRNVHRRN